MINLKDNTKYIWSKLNVQNECEQMVHLPRDGRHKCTFSIENIHQMNELWRANVIIIIIIITKQAPKRYSPFVSPRPLLLLHLLGLFLALRTFSLCIHSDEIYLNARSSLLI